MADGLLMTGLRRVLTLLMFAGAATSHAQMFPGYEDEGRNTAPGSNGRDGRDSRDSRDRRAGSDQPRSASDAADSQIAAPSAARDFEPTEIYNRSSSDDANSDDSEAIRRRARETPRRVMASEFELYVSEIVDKPLRRFGSNLLVPTARDFTSPPSTTIPPDYRLNPGDEIIVGLTGSVTSSDLRLKIDSQGRVFIPRVGSVNVAGVRYGDLQSVLSAQVSRQYRNFTLSVGIGQLRGITVYVTGFAATPGSYTLSSLSTLVNAVLAAGGPSTGGSFRSIQLRRGGKLISDFDLYDLLLRGDKSADKILQNGDVIYLAPVGPQAAVIGSVNNEAIFEAAPNETVADLLLEAGGINTVADDTRALLLDPLKDTSIGWEELLPAEARVRKVPRAAIIRVLSGVGLVRPRARQSVLVTISGEVATPGRYYLPANTRLADAITRAGGLTRDAYSFASVFTRESVKLQQRANFQRALREFETSLTVSALTSTLTPQGSQTERIFAARTIVAELAKVKPDGRLVLEIAPTSPGLPGDVVLENNDALYIPPRPTTIGVFGAVANPATFYMDGGRTVGDYIARSGGLQRFGNRKEIFVVRANGSVISRRGTRTDVLKLPALPGDLVFVPVNGERDKFWLRLRDLSGILLPTTLSASAISSVAK